ncbi:hypothetical protein F183_A33820 [Bryobacterales bacterium F-183]|nr:hypothetical protein F183_A33820 [Bryobacterales bacterium F-183]
MEQPPAAARFLAGEDIGAKQDCPCEVEGAGLAVIVRLIAARAHCEQAEGAVEVQVVVEWDED